MTIPIFIKVSIISLLNVFIKIITYLSLSFLLGKIIDHPLDWYVYLYNNIYINNDQFS